MPKREFSHQAGQPVPSQLKELIESVFGAHGVERLERFGGRVSISLTSPYISRKKGEKDSIIIDASFVRSLRAVRDKPEELKLQISPLPARKLRELGSLLGHPVRSKSTREDIVEELVRHLYSEEVWRRITGVAQ
jgi:hypothetical protein